MPTLIFLHGFLGSPADASWWKEILPSWQIVAPEIGMADDWESELKRLTAQLPSSAVIAGYSMGARLALGLAVNAPDRLRRLILISGNPGLATEAERTARIVQDLAWRNRLLRDRIQDFLEAWYGQPVFAHEPVDLVRTLKAEKMPLDRQRAAQMLKVLSVADQPNYRPFLPGLNMPVLLLAGARDEKYVSMAGEMKSLLPKATFKVVPDAGHVLHRSHPEATCAAVREFLAAWKEIE